MIHNITIKQAHNMLNRSKIIHKITQFKSIYRRHLHPDIKKTINLPSLGLNRRALQHISNAELIKRTIKLIDKINYVQNHRDREHKGLKDFSQQLRYLINDTTTDIPTDDVYRHLIDLSQKIAKKEHLDIEINEILLLAKSILKSGHSELEKQAEDIISATSQRSDQIGQAVHQHFSSLLRKHDKTEN